MSRAALDTCEIGQVKQFHYRAGQRVAKLVGTDGATLLRKHGLMHAAMLVSWDEVRSAKDIVKGAH